MPSSANALSTSSIPSSAVSCRAPDPPFLPFLPVRPGVEGPADADADSSAGFEVAEGFFFFFLGFFLLCPLDKDVPEDEEVR